MYAKFMFFPNENKQNKPSCWLELLVEKFGINQSKFNKSTQSFWADKTFKNLGNNVF